MPLTVEGIIRFERAGQGAGHALAAHPERVCPLVEPGRVPRVSRLLGLAHHFDALISQGIVADYADLARLGHVSRARISQIMNLLLLAPDIQEEILFLPRTLRGRDALRIWQLQPVALTADWGQQRKMWRQIKRKSPRRPDAYRAKKSRKP